VTLFEELGGEAKLRQIVDHFVDRVTADTMIGFFFAKVNKGRLKELEYQFAAQHLGGPVPYTGRTISDAHRRHPIMGGQFRRRLKILEETLEHFDVPPSVKQHWLEHTLSLEADVTRDSGGRCDPELALEKTRSEEKS
jgi:hemoglobin